VCERVIVNLSDIEDDVRQIQWLRGFTVKLAEPQWHPVDRDIDHGEGARYNNATMINSSRVIALILIKSKILYFEYVY